MGTHTTALRAPSPAARSPVDDLGPRLARPRRRRLHAPTGPLASSAPAGHAGASNDPAQLDDAQLEDEVHALRRWLRGHPSGADAAQATARLQALEAVVHARQPHAFRYGDTMVRWGLARGEGRATPYAAVPPGGRSLAHVAAWLYAGEGAPRALLEDNPGLPEHLPAGTGLRVRVDAMAAEARRNWDRARRNDLVLLTDEVPGVGRGDERSVSFTWRRRHVTLTRPQYEALLEHEAWRVRQSVHALQDDLRGRLQTHFRLAPEGVVELMVQDAVDRGGPTAQRPGEDLWLAPLGRLTAAIVPRHGARSVEQLARAWLVVADVSEQLRDNVAVFDSYMAGTIARGEGIVARLETTRDVAFATAAMLAGGAVVAGIVGQGGLTALTGMVALKALGAGAATGAAVYGGLEATTATLGEAASTRARERIDWRHVGERVRHGVWHGGVIGAASAFEALLFARFSFAFANEAGGALLTRLQSLSRLSPARQRLLLEALSQVPAATARSLLENLPAVLEGAMPVEQWLDLAGHDARTAGVAVGLRHVVGALLRTGPHATHANRPPSNEAPSPTGGAVHAPEAAPGPTASPTATGHGARDVLREVVVSGGSTALVDLPSLAAGERTPAQYGEAVLTGAVMSLGMTAARQTHGASRRALRERRQRLVRDSSPEARAEAEARLTLRMRRQVGDRAEVVIDPDGSTGIHVTEGADGRVVLRVGADATEWHLRNHVESGQAAHRALGRPTTATTNRVVVAARRWLDRVGHRSLRQRGGQARQDIRKLGNMVAEADGMIAELEARQAAGRGTPEEAVLLHELRVERASYVRQIEGHRQHAGAVEARPVDIAAHYVITIERAGFETSSHMADGQFLVEHTTIARPAPSLPEEIIPLGSSSLNVSNGMPEEGSLQGILMARGVRLPEDPSITVDVHGNNFHMSNAALDNYIEHFRLRFEDPPVNIPGTLAHENLRRFQVELAAIRADQQAGRTVQEVVDRQNQYLEGRLQEGMVPSLIRNNVDFIEQTLQRFSTRRRSLSLCTPLAGLPRDVATRVLMMLAVRVTAFGMARISRGYSNFVIAHPSEHAPRVDALNRP